ncbi:MAG: hypothetical protein VB086_12335 [Clostridiaceae bacterium]|nr:hypothetical protein [Clostridiaceae bacterium]
MAMEFETKLSPEIIRQRLSAGTRPMNFANGLSEHRLLFKWNKNNTFYLFKTGGIFLHHPLCLLWEGSKPATALLTLLGNSRLRKRQKSRLPAFLVSGGSTYCLAVF